MHNLAGKTAVVTGAASGIGLAMATAFAGAGMSLALIDVDAAQLERARLRWDDTKTRVETAVLDVSDEAAVRAAAEKLHERLGPIQIVANNAGVGLRAPLLEMTAANLNWLMAVNIAGIFHVSQAFLKPLINANLPGHMIVTASIASLIETPAEHNGAYAATKMAALCLATYLRSELREHNIGVSAICPGVVKTNARKSGEHRPARFGGAFARPDGDQAREGMEATDIARLVMRAIEDNAFLVASHPRARSMITERNSALLEQFDTWTPIIEDMGISFRASRFSMNAGMLGRTCRAIHSMRRRIEICGEIALRVLDDSTEHGAERRIRLRRNSVKQNGIAFLHRAEQRNAIFGTLLG